MKRLKATTHSAMRRAWVRRNRPAFSDVGAIRRPRLLVDVSVIMRHDAGTGIQRVVRSVWSHLRALDTTEFDVVPVHAGRSRGYCFAPAHFLARPRVSAGRPVAARAGDKFLGLDLAAHYLPDCVGQLDAWRDNGATVHCIVYDLLPLSRPDWFEEQTRHQFERWLATVAAHADQALCISETVAQDLRRRIAGTAAHHRLAIGRLHLSGDISGSLPSTGRSPNVAAILERARSRNAVLMIGTIEPRKAYGRAIDAFEHLWASGTDLKPDLIIVGKPGWKTDSLQDRIRTHPEQGQRLHWLEDVSDEALTDFYESSSAILLASYDEGFGLPLVEAAMHRRWALARDLPIFREQRLPNVRYFRDDSPESLSGTLLDLLRDSAAGRPPAAASPNWEWCVERLLEEIGLAAAPAVREPPKLRIVS